MKNGDYIANLISYFCGPFLQALAACDSSVIANLEKCRCNVDQKVGLPTVSYRLGDMFDALWLCAAAGIDLPSDSSWDANFTSFCNQLMFPWPDELFEANGYRIRLVRKGKSKAASMYVLAPFETG